MPPFEVDAKSCIRDGLCVAEYPARIIRLLPSDAVPAPEPDFASFCIRCGHCVAICPTAAFRLDWLGPEQCTELRAEDRSSAPSCPRPTSARSCAARWGTKRDKSGASRACGAPSRRLISA